MELTEVEATLPNGFHDLKLAALHLNLCEQTMVLEVDVLMGLPDQDVEAREVYQSALLEFKGVRASAVDPPDSGSSYKSPGAASVVISENEADAFPENLLAELPGDLRIYTIYVRDWLANIRIAATGVELKWKNGDSTAALRCAVP